MTNLSDKTQNLKFTIALPADRRRVATFFSELVLESAQLNPAFLNWSPAAIDQAVDQYQFYLLTKDDDQLVSLICYQQGLDWLEILALGTLQKHQRQGLSKQLLTSFAKECGATSKKIILEVHQANLAAIALYEKCGFITVRIRQKYYSDGQNALVMDLQL